MGTVEKIDKRELPDGGLGTDSKEVQAPAALVLEVQVLPMVPEVQASTAVLEVEAPMMVPEVPYRH